IINKTNGITFRRWLHNANPELTALAVEAAGEGVLDDPTLLERLVPFADDPEFRKRYAAMRKVRKKRLAQVIAERTGVTVDPSAL
ncbi:glycogen/starch/alpha-glucan phosphorylase, partial [Acinetobacter baumannii]